MNAEQRPRRLAVYPGSFDPITRGHEDIIRRALRFADRLIVAVAHTATHAKDGLFPIRERVAMIEDTFAEDARVDVLEFDGLLVDFAREHDARLIVRGLRAVSDFEYEFQMALMNRQLWPDVETIFLAPDVEHSYLSASLVREVASLGGDTTGFVNPGVQAKLEDRFGDRS